MAGLGARALSLLTGIAASAMPAPPVTLINERSDDYYLLLEDRSVENPAVPLSQITSWNNFFGGPVSNAASGVVVTSETAMRVSAVYACINRIAGTVAMLPMGVFREVAAGRELDKEDALQQLYIYGPDEFMNWFDFVFILVASALANGNSYALIERDRYMRPTGLRFLQSGECSPIYVSAGRTRYLYYSVFGEMVEKRDVIHLRCHGPNGIIGKSPIEIFAEGIGLSLAAESFAARFYGQGGNMNGVLEHPGNFKDAAAIDRLRSQFSERQTGLANAHKPLILEGGMKFNPITIPPNHAQFIETRNFQVEDIARMYGVPQHKIGKLDRSTNNNIEHQNKEYITDTILPWTERIRQEFERKLIPEADKGDKEIVFDFDFLLRGDSAAEAAKTQSLFNTGSITQNEIRRRNNLNRLPGLDDTYVQMNMQRVIPGSHMGATPPKKTTKKTPTVTSTEP